MEKLRSGDDLSEWVRQSQILDTAVRVTSAQLVQARQLREAMFRLIAGLIDGRPPAAGDRELVNKAAARPQPRLELAGDGQVRRRGDLSAVLAVVAQDCIDLFESPDREALHWCADAACTRPFIDRSRGHRRRWCGMKGCGDRAKAAAYRERQRRAKTVA